MKNLPHRTIKKTMLMALTATAIMATPVAGAFAAEDKSPFDGPYVGGALTLNKFNSGASVTPATTTTLEGKQKVAGGIYGGYGVQMDQLYFGLEGGFYLNRSPSPTLSFGTTNTGLKAKNTFDLGARLGFVADRVLFYGLGGFTSTKFDTFGLATNENKRLSGFRYGGGMEFALTPTISLRAEYTRANYKKWDVTSGTDSITFDPNDRRFLVGATFRF
ncbi:hypothetical protein MNBD_ALPHA01-657 [hydrothermal vent metagenome]|uniref:Outer membrane protein beta-barrel domain-containing protein n=1 Tax=hydrothermal vent metagenome TaxID=652676 RepID=A0A3B0SF10_9ZZZZ